MKSFSRSRIIESDFVYRFLRMSNKTVMLIAYDSKVHTLQLKGFTMKKLISKVVVFSVILVGVSLYTVISFFSAEAV